MWLAVLLIFGVVGAVVVLALVFAKDPPSEEERAGGPTALDRFLAEARGDRAARDASPAPTRPIPTARPRSRARQRPAETPVPTPPPPRPEPTVIILAREPEPVVVVPVEVVEPPVVPVVTRRPATAAARRVVGLLQDRDTLQAAFLLNEILRRPRFPRPPHGPPS